ncbi:MAG: hypothetical protein M1374_04985 [Firmicutes bacterium]|nr:hypothetical protein [Bacillota bacterium]
MIYMLSLKVGKSRGRDYLSIITKYWDRENKQSRTKTVRSLGYVDELKKDFIDPIAHFKEVVAVMNQEIEAENKNFSISLNKDELLSNRTGIRKNGATGILVGKLSKHKFGFKEFVVPSTMGE